MFKIHIEREKWLLDETIAYYRTKRKFCNVFDLEKKNSNLFVCLCVQNEILLLIENKHEPL